MPTNREPSAKKPQRPGSRIPTREECEQQLRTLALAFRAMANASGREFDARRAQALEDCVRAAQGAEGHVKAALRHRRFSKSTIDKTQVSMELTALAVLPRKASQPWLTIASIANLLGTTKPTARAICRRRGITLHRDGNRDLVDPRQLKLLALGRIVANQRREKRLLDQYHGTESEKIGKKRAV